MLGELKELQINIFYDHPSTNDVPPWQPRVSRAVSRVAEAGALEGRLGEALGVCVCVGWGVGVKEGGEVVNPEPCA